MPRAEDPNLARLSIVAERLGPLLPKVVFLGGCAAGLLITDEAAAPVRATRDVDLIVEILALTDYHHFEESVRQLGFQPVSGEEALICRWEIDGIITDIMPTREEILGFSNEWYNDAIRNARKIRLSDDLVIRAVNGPYFVATKLEAFNGRGGGDYRASHDLEDIITVVDGRVELVEEIQESGDAVRIFLAKSFSQLLESSDFRESVAGHLAPDPASQARLPKVTDRLEQISQLG
ncbi:hypothetical protein MYX82_06220 [Acidobacteria bacterium AH-259-D05]|nr:hypothetical protein [Acidobacteria bacterium AH-259-D05]